MNTLKTKEKRIDEIRRLCEENGLSMAEVFRKSDIPYNTVQNWERSEPQAFQTYDRLKETIEALAAQDSVEGENRDL